MSQTFCSKEGKINQNASKLIWIDQCPKAQIFRKREKGFTFMSQTFCANQSKGAVLRTYFDPCHNCALVHVNQGVSKGQCCSRFCQFAIPRDRIRQVSNMKPIFIPHDLQTEANKAPVWIPKHILMQIPNSNYDGYLNKKSPSYAMRWT